MNLKNTLTILLGAICLSSTLFAQENEEKTISKKRKFLTTNNGIEGHNLQFTQINKNGSTLNTNPRYSYYFNMGSDVNLGISKCIKPFTGIYLKNIGLITKEGSLITKHRVYAIGVPVGLKFYSTDKKTIFKLGADFNYALNYKQKTFIDDKKINKFNEWNSERTPSWMPSLFAGIRYHGLSMTANYYYNNFFNQDFVDNGTKPYANTDAKMFTFSIGFTIDNQRGKGKQLKKQLMKHKSEVKA